ncbi:MAG: HAD-IIB family hydrolase [Rhodoferax sp.]|uniref:HAD-IIB family hydrolase n=1 Tax=Rhodoferax sp. TaxID=50421 RepID=UPI00260FB4D2|nr:HAD-IIB family hydrolase [Rhodoferax sp.]MDD2879460.1 HAD-IIB family hydrolase [Rhodoferax sp.]
MTPLSDWPLEDRRRLIGVFTDIDDTLTTDGAITTEALQALSDLKAAGLHVIPITGRPIGWCEPFANGNTAQHSAPWAVDAIVAENGAVAFTANNLCGIGLQPLSNKRKQLSKIYLQTDATRALNVTRMQQVAAQVLREVPEARLSQDSHGRETDIAIDHSEFAHLPPDKIAQVVAIMQAAGMTATVSSIHINGWFGAHNKLEGARWIARELFGRALDAELSQWAYVGDSTNDKVMFAHFQHSIGVANIRRFAAELTHAPRYITAAERGTGFAEVAQAILTARA